MIKNICGFSIALTLCFAHSVISSEKSHDIIKENIISNDVEDFDCHSSSLIEVSPGVLCAFWKGGPGKGTSNVSMTQNVGIWFSRFEKDNWSTPKEIVSSPNSVCWTPVITQLSNGELVLFYRIGSDPRHVIGLIKRSLDGGLNWSDPEILPAGIFGPTKSKPVFDREGNMICGSSVEAGSPEDELKATACWIEVLSKDGRWSKYGPIEIPGKRFGCIEPTLFWGKDGELRMLCRDRSNKIGSVGWIWTAQSMDNGKTWSQLEKTNLPNPDAAIETVQLPEGKILLIYNHSHTSRFPLSLAISTNYGNSWVRLLDIESTSGEFPSAVLDSQGDLHVIYSWKPESKIQRRIKHVVHDLKKLALDIQ